MRIGCCGFGMAKAAYYERFGLVEIQETFYQPPRIKTVEKWRSEAPANFEFALKAWQLITHTAQSPTFRRLRSNFPQNQRLEAGSFRLTPTVEHAYNVSVECALALRAKRLIFQCPGSFKPTAENLENMRRFFLTVKRPPALRFLWEPRGDWAPELIAELCASLNIEHVVDPFVTDIASASGRYYRLHGIGSWRHVYSDEQIESLLDLTLQYVAKSDVANSGVAKSDLSEPVYVLFNNGAMIKDALRYEALLQARLPSQVK